VSITLIEKKRVVEAEAGDRMRCTIGFKITGSVWCSSFGDA